MFLRIFLMPLTELCQDRLGVVHSFTGTREELEDYLEFGFHIGINGCSLKTEENCELVKHIPLDKVKYMHSLILSFIFLSPCLLQ